MKILTKIERPALNDSASPTKANGSTGDLVSDRLSYCHTSAVEGGAALADGGRGGTGGNSAIDAFNKAMVAAAAARKGEVELGPVAFTAPLASKVGMRRDRRARSAAAEALINEKSPPAEMKMGLGWACLHVDVAVYTENKEMTQPKRVVGHIQWCNFWGIYQVGLAVVL